MYVVKSGNLVPVGIRPLCAEDFPQVHATIGKGFSLDIHPNHLHTRLIQNGYDPCMSVGAFIDGSMIGAWLTGVRVIDGAKIAYGAGTAVIPEWRRRGIGQKMLDLVDEICKSTNVTKYILTTYKSNDAAINLYGSNGYRISRPLATYKLTHSSSQTHAESIFRVDDLSVRGALELMGKMLDYKPSWRNSPESIETIEEALIAAAVKDINDRTIVYGIYQPMTASLIQIGVEAMSQSAESEAVKLLLYHFYKLHPDKRSTDFIEAPSDAHRIVSLLTEAGFIHVQDLVEMIKEY